MAVYQLSWLAIATVISLSYMSNDAEASVTIMNNRSETIEIIDDFSARFGPRLSKEGLKGHIYVAKPLNGCSTIDKPPNISYVKNWIALIQRTPSMNSNCSFDLKVFNAQKANFSAVIIFNIDSEHLVRMSSSGVYDIKIPSAFVGESDGKELKDFYTYDKGHYVLITDDDYTFSIYLIPFTVVVGTCFLILVSGFVIKCVVLYMKSRKNRLSKSALKKLPTKKYQKTDKYDTCPICLDEYEEGVKLRILPCEHMYHIKCIDEWLLKNNRNCPVCKRRVLPGDDDSESESENSSHNVRSSGNASNNRNPERRSNNANVNQDSDNELILATDANQNEESDERSRLLANASSAAQAETQTRESDQVLIQLKNEPRITSSASSSPTRSTYGSIINSTSLEFTEFTSAPASINSPQLTIINDQSKYSQGNTRTTSHYQRSAEEKKARASSFESASSASQKPADDQFASINLDDDANDEDNDDDEQMLIAPAHLSTGGNTRRKSKSSRSSRNVSRNQRDHRNV